MQNQITLQEAIDLTTTFRNCKEKILSAPYQNTHILCNSETFSGDAVRDLLNQEGCVDFRIYLGMNEEKTEVKLILVGVNPDGGDMVSDSSIILDLGVRCPDSCPPPSALNP